MKEKQKLFIFCFVYLGFFINLNKQAIAMPAFSPPNIFSNVSTSTGIANEYTPSSPYSVEQKEPKMPDAGPETVDIDEAQVGLQGNWVKKREWLKEAQKVNGEIQDLILNIQKLRKPFYEKYSTIDNELDTFYKQEGFEQGKIQELFDGLLHYLEKKRKKEIQTLKAETDKKGVTGEYEIKLDIVEDDIKANKIELEQLKLDMTSILDLDKSVGERLKKLDEQVKLAVKQSEDANKITNEIWYIIDDQKARANYYKLYGDLLVRVKAVQEYVQGDFTQDFDQVLNIIRTQINKIKDDIKNLESKGFIIKDRVTRLSQIKLQKLDEEKYGKTELPAGLEEKKNVIKDFSWHEKLYNSFVDMVARIGNFFQNWFGIGVTQKVSTEIKTISEK